MFFSKTVTLSAPKDWDLWFSIIRRTAKGLNIWSKVNPENKIKAPSLSNPAVPILDVTGDLITQVDRIQLFDAQERYYKILAAKYKEEQKAFRELLTLIQSTISVQNLIYI